MKETELRERYRTQLQRKAWRIQYKNRFQQIREVSLLFPEKMGVNNDDSLVTRLFVNELILKIPQQQGRIVIEKLIVDGKTEKDISKELGISQQAVSKWKKKSLSILKQHMIH